MDIYELARYFEMQRDGLLTQEQTAALREYIAANPSDAAWWQRATATDQHLAQALQSRLDSASLTPAARERIGARLRTRSNRPALLRDVPVLLAAILLVLVGLSVARAWFATMPGAQPLAPNVYPPPATLALPTLLPPTCMPTPLVTPSLTPPQGSAEEQAPCVLLMPTPMPFSPAEAATATALSATDDAQTATAAQLELGTATAYAMTATAVAPFLPATQTAQAPTDVAATATDYAATVSALPGGAGASTSLTATIARATDYAETAIVQSGGATSAATPREGLSPMPCDLAQPPGTPTPVVRQPVPPPDTPTSVLLQESPSVLCETPTPMALPRLDPALGEHTAEALAALGVRSKASQHYNALPFVLFLSGASSSLDTWLSTAFRAHSASRSSSSMISTGTS
jgi:hypothetical protein